MFLTRVLAGSASVGQLPTTETVLAFIVPIVTFIRHVHTTLLTIRRSRDPLSATFDAFVSKLGVLQDEDGNGPFSFRAIAAGNPNT